MTAQTRFRLVTEKYRAQMRGFLRPTQLSPSAIGPAEDGATDRHRTEWRSDRLQGCLADDVAQAEFWAPGLLSGLPASRPKFSAAAKMDNYYGVMIPALHRSRILDYRRDKVVDVATGQVLEEKALSAMMIPQS